MLSKSRTNQPEKGFSFFCRILDTNEHINNSQFDLEKATKFFSRNSTEMSEKSGSDLLFLIKKQDIICSEADLETRTNKWTKKIRSYWLIKNAIPNEISRYVIELNIPAAAAQKLYNEEKFIVLSQHIISLREDTINKGRDDWMIGTTQVIEINTKESPRCRM